MPTWHCHSPRTSTGSQLVPSASQAGSSTCSVKIWRVNRETALSKQIIIILSEASLQYLSQMGWEPFPCHAFMQSLKLLLFVARSVVCRSWGSVSCSPDNCATRCTHYALVKIWACEKRRVFLLVNTSAQTFILMNCTDGDKCICPFYAMAALTLCAVMTRWQIQRLWAKNCIFSKGHSSLTRPPGGN